MFVFHNYNTLTIFFFFFFFSGHVGARGGNIPRIQVFNNQIGRIRLFLIHACGFFHHLSDSCNRNGTLDVLLIG